MGFSARRQKSMMMLSEVLDRDLSDTAECRSCPEHMFVIMLFMLVDMVQITTSLTFLTRGCILYTKQQDYIAHNPRTVMRFTSAPPTGRSRASISSSVTIRLPRARFFFFGVVGSLTKSSSSL